MEEIKLRAPVSAPDHEFGKQLIEKSILDGARVTASTALIQGNQPARESIIERLKVPEGLNVDSGKYKHQGDALEKLKENNYSGMLCIATGGGKTKTSLVAATRVQDSHPE
jgi:CRISPR/Cas system-associated endonuclease/helicase Cas3